ncbi:hypothetical protein [Longimicrobium sp.]|uniref:hypothetical protein n=1 Tax=Longimicrobium sp. TaxID=2029185 RepID=UPI002B568138|nr:hypothetical protein [Longimicrobium sp.]HSU13369.1 hypothetical protein [Longimicrobium sp.]
MRRLSPAMLAGLVSGLLFYLNALVPYSHAWPLVWPVLGGAAAVVLARRAGHGRGALGTGAAAGAIAGGVFLALTIPTLFLLSLPSMEGVDRLLGGDGRLVVTGSMMIAIAAAAAFGIPSGAIGGIAGRLVARPRAV